MRDHVRPPSSVRRRMGVHDGAPKHDMPPRTQPNWVEAKVTDRASKPGGVEVVGGADVEVGAEGVVRGIVDETVVGVPPPHAVNKTRDRTSGAAIASRRTSTMVSRPFRCRMRAAMSNCQILCL
jgi:hypothetical protein